MSKNQKNKSEKICGICGDTAVGRNFGGLSCESCKTFFRRNGFKQISSLKCRKNDEKCVIIVVNRSSCLKCRLIKCLGIGMKRELILKKRGQLSLNCLYSEKEEFKGMCDSIESKSSSSNDLTHFDPEFDASFENHCLSEQQTNEQIIEEFINSTSFDRLQTYDKICQKTVIPVVRPIATFNKDLNDMEVYKLSELSSATHCIKCLFTPITKNRIVFSTLKDYYILRNTCNKFDEYIKQFVKYCKNLSSFKEVCEDDQLSLLKTGFYESSTWLNFSFIDINEENFSIYFENGYTIRFYYDLLKRENPKFYDLCKKFLQKINIDLISDSTIRNLLSAIALFNPERQNLVHKELIKLKQQMYLYLLQRYLIQKYISESESMKNCANILSSVHEMQTLTKFHKEIEKKYIEFSTPLLRQFMD